jgi:hypothetical protein
VGPISPLPCQPFICERGQIVFGNGLLIAQGQALIWPVAAIRLDGGLRAEWVAGVNDLSDKTLAYSPIRLSEVML